MYLAKKLIYLKVLGWISQHSCYPISSSIIAVMSLSLLLSLASHLKILNVDERFSLDWRLVVKDGWSLLKGLSRFLDLPAYCDVDFLPSDCQSVLVLSTYIVVLAPVDNRKLTTNSSYLVSGKYKTMVSFFC